MKAVGCSSGLQDRLRRSIAGNGDVDAALQPLKPGGPAPGIERHDLAVEHDRARKRRPHSPSARDQFRKLRRLFVAESRPEPDARWPGGCLPVRRQHDGANSVVFRLVDQLGDQ